MDSDIHYDSDNIDEDLEASLYASIYFDHEECPPAPPSQSPPLNPLIHEPSDLNPPQNDAIFKTPLPAASKPTASSAVHPWKFPSGLEKRVTSLSSLADAIFLTLTGKYPPSVTEASAKRTKQRCVGPAAAKQQVATASYTNDKEELSTTDEGLIEENIDASENESGVDDDVTLSSGTSSSGNSASENSYQVETADIIIGVSNSNTKNTLATAGSATEVADILENMSSDPENWFIEPADQMPLVHNKRYYNPSQNQACSTCNKKGHAAFDCTRVSTFHLN